MLKQLNERFAEIIHRLSGQGRITEENIKETVRQVRIALLEADVALPVVQAFIETIRKEATGEKVLTSLSPGQTFIKIIHDALAETLGEATAELDLNSQTPTKILLAGLQGSGKTTTLGKLAYRLKTRENKKVLMASVDIYRPAAIEQLKILAEQVGVDFFESNPKDSPETIIRTLLEKTKNQFYDVILIDAAGRLHIDEPMMQEIKMIQEILDPVETLLVMDAMTGQDAIQTAFAFHEKIKLTGVVLTKLDGDARGGVALSVWKTIHVPIKLIGVGEKMDALEIFHPDRMASRILDMGDIVSLVEEVEQKTDKQQIEKTAKKIIQGKNFDLQDFLDQLEQMQQMGSITGLLSKMPGLGAMPKGLQEKISDKPLIQTRAIIQSMTKKERRFPDHIRHSQKQRIAKGSGTQVQDINRVLKQFEQMKKMMKKLKKGGGLAKMMQMMGGAGLNLPH